MSADTITPAVAVGAVLRARSRRTALVFVLAAALLAAVAVASILVGVRGIDPAAVWQAFTHPVADDVDHMVVLQQRLPRTLIGLAALVALVTPLTTLVLLRDQETFNSYRFWVIGALTGRDLGVLAWLLPFLGAGLVLAAVFLAHRLNGLALGDDIARGLGQNVRATRLLAGLAIVLLCGVGSKSENLIVGTLRLPRIQAALLAGAAFGLAGAVFQSVLRNPLASPDILGISSGASLGAVVAVLGWGWSGVAVSLSAFAGALTVAALIWGLAWRQGLHGLRFVLVGVGLAYLSGSLISWLLSQADVREAQPVLLWTVGSVADVRGGELGGLALLVALAADVLGQHAVPGVVAPVGIVTGLIGAPYLLFLLARQRKVAA